LNIQQRYLELLRKSLINELYLENDARLIYLSSAVVLGTQMDPDVLRNIGARLPDVVATLAKNLGEGRPWWNVPMKKNDGTPTIVSFRNYADFSHSMIGTLRMRNIEECLDVIREEGVPGDLAETGVWRGGSAVFMRGYLAAYEMPDRVVWAADSFEGLPPPTHPADAGFDFSAAVVPVLAVSLEEVKGVFARYGLLDDRVRFLKGWFRDSLPTAPIGDLALLRLDGDLYESTWDALSALYKKVIPGGFVLVDDYGDFPPCQKAVDEFRQQHDIREPMQKVDWSGIYWRKAKA
jgi:O-methyltransferase